MVLNTDTLGNDLSVPYKTEGYGTQYRHTR